MGDIFRAIRRGELYEIQDLIRRREINNLNPDGFTPLGYAIRRLRGKLVIDLLLRYDANPNIMESDGYTPFLALLINTRSPDYIESVRLFLDGKDGKQKADLAIPASDRSDYPGFTALHIAAQENRGDVIDLLIKNGANVNALILAETDLKRCTPLLIAALAGHERQVRRLIEARADPSIYSVNNTSPLSLAAKSGNLESVRALLNRLNNVNDPNVNGKTPLMYGCLSNRLDVVRFLMENGADVNSRANDGTTPLMVACEVSNLGIINHLLRARAEVNQRKNDGSSALMIAINERSTLPVLRTLLDAGADLNVADNEGRTPLFKAVQHRKYDIILELVRLGANPAHMVHGETIAAYARKQGLPAGILEALTFGRRRHALRYLGHVPPAAANAAVANAAVANAAVANAAAGAGAAATRRGGRRTRRRSTRRQRQR